MSLETNIIKELAPGVYWVLLWCPESSILRELLDPNTGYVLCWNHYVGHRHWSEFCLPLLDPKKPVNVISRSLTFDFVLPVGEFIELLPHMSAGISAVQLGTLPPDYLDMRRIRGKQLYRILGECGWHIFLDTPGNDYGEVMNPRREVLEQAIRVVGQEDDK